MKLNTITQLAGVAALLCMPAAFAQSHTNLKVNVPFSFSVGNQKLPAGEYNITSATGSQIMSITSEESRRTVMSLAGTGGKPSGDGKARVIFHVYGETSYLAGVWSPDTGGRTVPKCAAEREAERGQKPVEMAILVQQQ